MNKQNLGWFALALVLGAAVTWAGVVSKAAVFDGIVETTSGGYMFPDGTVQTTAAAQASAPVEDTGQDMCWDASGNGIACSGTGQDGELQAGVDWPTPRFTDNGDGTVTDNLTGLIWLQDANCFGTRSWTNALSDANGLMSGSCGLTDGSLSTDWHLSNVKEMRSLIDHSEFVPALPSGHPFSNVQTSSVYWLSSSVAAFPSDAWAINLDNGGLTGLGKNNVRFVWPVRGGQ